MEGDGRDEKDLVNVGPWFRLGPSVVLSVTSLLIALLSLYFTSLQASYMADQAQISKEALEISAAGLALAQEEADRKNEHQVVIDRATLQDLKGPLTNGALVRCSFSNMTDSPRSYAVVVESAGVGVHWANVTPEKMNPAIYLDPGPVVVAPGGTYESSFVVWHTSEPPRDASITMIVNDNVELHLEYEYKEEHQGYVIRSD
ncbi:MAG: hypothetical protein AAGD38_06070 [Acidobacteriota bacterium]